MISAEDWEVLQGHIVRFRDGDDKAFGPIFADFQARFKRLDRRFFRNGRERRFFGTDDFAQLGALRLSNAIGGHKRGQRT